MQPNSTKILIVEDHEDSRALLQLYLKMAGYGVVCASCCAEALKCVQEADFDLCILDHHLQDGTGANLRQQIRQCQPTMPVLYHTGTSYSNQQIALLRQQGDDYLLKPVEPVILKHSIAQLLAVTKARASA